MQEAVCGGGIARAILSFVVENIRNYISLFYTESFLVNPVTIVQDVLDAIGEAIRNYLSDLTCALFPRLPGCLF